MKNSERQQHGFEAEGQQDPPTTERGLGAIEVRDSNVPYQRALIDKSHQQTPTVPTGYTRFFAIQYWQQYFHISQEEVSQRILQSIKPLKPEFLRISQSNPDLYGPFWIMTTVIVLVSLSGNLSRYFRHWNEKQFEFRLELVRYALAVVYGYGILYSLLVGTFLRFFGGKLNPIVIVCLYGYSMSTFLGICVFCIIPSPVLHWLLILYGTINSTALILANLHSEAALLSQQYRYIFYSTVAVGQLAFLFTFKFTFYNLSYGL